MDSANSFEVVRFTDGKGRDQVRFWTKSGVPAVGGRFMHGPKHQVELPPEAAVKLAAWLLAMADPELEHAPRVLAEISGRRWQITAATGDTNLNLGCAGGAV